MGSGCRQGKEMPLYAMHTLYMPSALSSMLHKPMMNLAGQMGIADQGKTMRLNAMQHDSCNVLVVSERHSGIQLKDPSADPSMTARIAFCGAWHMPQPLTPA